MLRRLLQSGQGCGIALLQQSAQHVLNGFKQGIPSRFLCSSSTSKDVQYHRMKLRAAAIREIEQLLLPAGTLVRTSKGCRVDLGFCNPKGTLYLPLRVKAALVRDQRAYFDLSQRFQPEAMGTASLILCRPCQSPNQGRTLIATSRTFPQRSFGATLKEGMKYYPFLVPDGQLADVVADIYEAVKDGKEQTARLPSGQVIDISRLQLKAADELAVPSAPTNKRAREFSALHEQWLPALDIQPPYTVYGLVDTVIEGVRLADTVAWPTGKQGYQINLHKRCLKRKVEPLWGGDFDALWAYHPDKVHFWLIPAHVLVEKGVLANAQQRGKNVILLYEHGYTKPQQGRGADLWTQQYLLDSRDPGLMDEVIQVLKTAKP